MPMEISEWKRLAKERILSGKMTEVEWESVLSALLHVSEYEGLEEFDEAVDPSVYCHACSIAGGAERAVYHQAPACSEE